MRMLRPAARNGTVWIVLFLFRHDRHLIVPARALGKAPTKLLVSSNFPVNISIKRRLCSSSLALSSRIGSEGITPLDAALLKVSPQALGIAPRCPLSDRWHVVDLPILATRRRAPGVHQRDGRTPQGVSKEQQAMWDGGSSEQRLDDLCHASH
jgi:hypothetical protein